MPSRRLLLGALTAAALASAMTAACFSPPATDPAPAAARPVAAPTSTSATGARPAPTAGVTTTPATATSTVAARSREPGPDLLHNHSWSGAEAFVEDYLVRLDRAWTTPNPSLLDQRATTDCGTCANFRRAAATLAATGQRHEAPMLTVTDVSVVFWRGGPRVVADTRQTAHRVLTTSGRTVRRATSERAYLYVDLVYRGRWWVDAVGIEVVDDDGTHRGR